MCNQYYVRIFVHNLPNHLKSDFHENSRSFVQLADSRHVCVLGTAIVNCSLVLDKHDLFVHVIRDTSHQLIIGTEFMCKNNVVLDFCSKYYGTRTLKVKCKQRVIIQQNSKCIVQGILPKTTVIGLQGVCTSSKFMSKSGLVVARSVVTVHNTDCILVNILNL